MDDSAPNLEDQDRNASEEREELSNLLQSSPDLTAEAGLAARPGWVHRKVFSFRIRGTWRDSIYLLEKRLNMVSSAVRSYSIECIPFPIEWELNIEMTEHRKLHL